MKNIYGIKKEVEFEGMLVLKNIIQEEPLFTDTGDLGFVATTANEIYAKKLYNINNLENKMYSDIDSKGFCELNNCEITKMYIEKNYDCVIKQENNKMIITAKQ